MSDPRCGSCGALVAADAEWCGQCYASRRPAGAAASSASGDRSAWATAVERRGVRDDAGPPSAWRCPTCDADNGLEQNACRICGTPFGRLFEGPPPAPRISPAGAAAMSVVPGLGHWFAGRRADGVARFVLAAWVGGTLAALLASGDGGGGFGPIGALVALFAAAALALWAESALDAHRVASGLRPAVSSRALLWASIGLVALSLVLATILTLPNLDLGGPGGPIK